MRDDGRDIFAKANGRSEIGTQLSLSSVDLRKIF